MNLPGREAFKAYVASAGTFLTGLLAEWTATDPLTPRDLVASASLAVATFLGTYFVTNKEA